MSGTEKTFAAFAALLFLGILRWACVARITFDEGSVLTAIAFADGVPIVAMRLFVYFLITGLLGLAARFAGLTVKASFSAAALFLLWVLCLVWRPDINGSSINLIANVRGEGVGFSFALLAHVLAVHEKKSLRQWVWLSAALAVCVKSAAALAVICPLVYLVWSAWKKRSFSWIGVPGLFIGLLIGSLVLAVSKGGDHARGVVFTSQSQVHPFHLLFLTSVAAGFLFWVKRAKERAQLFATLLPILLLASISIYYLWYLVLVLAGRDGVHDLWIGYALLGWLASVLAARLIESQPKHWPIAGAMVLVLAVVAVFWGTLPALGPLGPTERWETQRQLAQELVTRYPHSRLMVAGSRTVPYIAFFMKRIQYNMFDVQPIPGDLLLCDTESGCDEAIFQYCEPKMTDARVAWCHNDR